MRAVAGDWRHMEREAVRAAVSDVEIPWRAERRQKRGVALGGESGDFPSDYWHFGDKSDAVKHAFSHQETLLRQ